MLKKYLIRPVVIILLLGFSVGVFFFRARWKKKGKVFGERKLGKSGLEKIFFKWK